jgi:hypothetical protein
MSSVLINLVAFIHLLGAPEAVADETRVAQAVQVSQVQETSNRAANALAAAQKKQRSIEAEKAKLRTTYNKQLAQVDKLKRARASWRRDRQLRDQKARSQKTALALKEVDRKLRSQRSAVSKARKALATAIDKELDLSPTPARQTYLKSMLGKVRVGLRVAPKKISMPELELDEFADPEELLEQIALIERAEAKLAREQASLTRRADYYARMETLRSKRQRADALGVFDEDGVRRSTGHVGNKNDRNSDSSTTGGAGADLADSESAGEPAPQSPSNDDFGGGGGGSFEAASVVLADVVDSGTQDALRRAHRSNSPKTKAAAAKRAKDQVSDRLLRLRASKAKIRRHLKRLQKR